MAAILVKGKSVSPAEVRFTPPPQRVLYRPCLRTPELTDTGQAALCGDHHLLWRSKAGLSNLDANRIKSIVEKLKAHCAEDGTGDFPSFFSFWRQDGTLYTTEWIK